VPVAGRQPDGVAREQPRRWQHARMGRDSERRCWGRKRQRRVSSDRGSAADHGMAIPASHDCDRDGKRRMAVAVRRRPLVVREQVDRRSQARSVPIEIGPPPVSEPVMPPYAGARAGRTAEKRDRSRQLMKARRQAELRGQPERGPDERNP